MHRRGCRPRSFAAVITNHSSHRQSHSINKGWIIGLDSSDFSTTGQLQLATRLWRFQCERLPVARNHSLHPKPGRTPSDPNFSTGIRSVSEAARAQFRRQISLGLTKGLTMTSAVPPGRGSFCIATQALRTWLLSRCPSGTKYIHPPRLLLKLTLMGARPYRLITFQFVTHLFSGNMDSQPTAGCRSP